MLSKETLFRYEENAETSEMRECINFKQGYMGWASDSLVVLSYKTLVYLSIYWEG